MEVIHALYGRNCVRVGQCGRGAHGGGQDGADPDCQSAGELGSAHLGVGQQAGPAGGARAPGVGEAVGTVGVGDWWGAPLARAACLCHHRGRPPRGPRSALRNDFKAAETGQNVQEEDEVKRRE